MKTILEWLEWAKEQGYEWADAAIRNYDPNFMSIKEANSLIASLENAFVWGNSPEKYEYWDGVCESLRAAEEEEEETTVLEDMISDLGRLNNALGNLAYNDTLKEPYRTQIYEATKASYKEQLAEVKADIAKVLGLKGRELIGWVVANPLEKAYLIGKPEKTEDRWIISGMKKTKAGWILAELTPEEAIALCGRVPKWSDEEPIPVYEK